MESIKTMHLQLPKLNGKNYDSWSIQLKVYFRSQELWSFVETGFEDVTDSDAYEALSQEAKSSLNEKRKKDQKALYSIF